MKGETMNSCTFIGKIVNELVLRDSKPNDPDNSSKVMTFNLLHQGGGKPQTIKCEAWRGHAKSIFKYKKEGEYIGLSGSIRKDENGAFYLVIDKVNLMVEKKTKKTAADTVFGFIERSKKGVTTETLMKKTGFAQKKIFNIVYKLKQQGKIKSDQRGIYLKS